MDVRGISIVSGAGSIQATLAAVVKGVAAVDLAPHPFAGAVGSVGLPGVSPTYRAAITERHQQLLPHRLATN